MKISKTTIDDIRDLRTEYLNSLPEFQELFIELMISDSEFFILKNEDEVLGYAIRNKEGVLIEFYILNRYLSDSADIFNQVLRHLSISDIYCKSFDSLLLGTCLLSSFSYSIIGLLYREYIEPLIRKDTEVSMKRTDLSSIGFFLEQDESIKELFESKQQLTNFIQNESVFEFYKNDSFIGCGTIIKTHSEWDFCDLGVWVNPAQRGNSYGSQIILNMREFALQNGMKPSCGCAINNIASQKTIVKSGYVSKQLMISFRSEF